MAEAEALLNVRNLKKYFPIHGGVFQRKIGEVRAVDDISFSIRKGETMGLVGESGCGKSTAGRTILRLYEPTAGEIEFDGINLTELSPEEMRQKRRDFQMVFQDPSLLSIPGRR